MLLFAALVAVSLSATLQFAPSSLVVAGSAVPIANQGDVLGVGTVPALANFDGMGTMLDPSNSSQLHLIVNTEVMVCFCVVVVFIDRCGRVRRRSFCA
jgi:ABC-type multidrug transport system permease subunit